VLSEEQEKLFGKNKPGKAAISDQLEHLREHDREQRARVEEQMIWESDAKDSTSPALEAQRRESYGWPGLGTYPEPPTDPAKVQRRSSSTAKRAAELEPRVEAATFEAIDNAAESEAYGWPGLGEFKK